MRRQDLTETKDGACVEEEEGRIIAKPFVEAQMLGSLNIYNDQERDA